MKTNKNKQENLYFIFDVLIISEIFENLFKRGR